VKSTQRLRELLARPGAVMAPGVADALNARLVKRHGFEAVYMTGAGTTAVRLGMPDVGLLTATEMIDNAGRIAEASGLPLIADADNGYGGVLNVRRTVRGLESAGAAMIQIEDQVMPKRCGHFDDKQVVREAEMVARIRAACDARRDPSTLILGRTDARHTEGLDGAIARARAYAAAGADLLFVEAPLTVDELAAIPRALPVPAVVNIVEGGRTPALAASELEAMGYRVVIYANTALRVAAFAVRDAMRELIMTGSSRSLEDRMLAWDERQRLVRLPEHEELDRRAWEG